MEAAGRPPIISKGVLLEDVIEVIAAKPLGITLDIFLERRRVGVERERIAVGATGAGERLARPVRHALTGPVPCRRNLSRPIRRIGAQGTLGAMGLVGMERVAIGCFRSDHFGIKEPHEVDGRQLAMGRQGLMACQQSGRLQSGTPAIRFVPTKAPQDRAKFAAQAGHASRRQAECCRRGLQQPAQAAAIHLHEGRGRRSVRCQRLGCRYPIIQTAMGWVAPAPTVETSKGPPHFGVTGWLAHIDMPSLILTALQPVPSGEGANRAVAVRMIECAGFGGAAEIRFARDPNRASLIDGMGKAIQPLTMLGDAVQVEYSAGETLRVLLEWT